MSPRTRSERVADMGLTKVAGKIARREPFEEAWLFGYVTKGGTYVLATSPLHTDSGKPRDLVAVLPGDLGQGRAIALYLAVNPELVRVVGFILRGAR